MGLLPPDEFLWHNREIGLGLVSELLMVTENSFNVLITGATTPLGREVTRQLAARGHHVTGLTEGSANATLVRQDGGIPAFVTDPFRISELKSVFHAAQADVVLHLVPQLINGFPRRDLPWEATLPMVGEGAIALVRAAEQSNNPYFIYPSFAFL